MEKDDLFALGAIMFYIFAFVVGVISVVSLIKAMQLKQCSDYTHDPKGCYLKLNK